MTGKDALSAAIRKNRIRLAETDGLPFSLYLCLRLADWRLASDRSVVVKRMGKDEGGLFILPFCTKKAAACVEIKEGAASALAGARYMKEIGFELVPLSDLCDPNCPDHGNDEAWKG